MKTAFLYNLGLVWKQNRLVKLNLFDSKVFHLKFTCVSEGEGEKKNCMASPLGVTSK